MPSPASFAWNQYVRFVSMRSPSGQNEPMPTTARIATPSATDA
jgi:hypothetical protein